MKRRLNVVASLALLVSLAYIAWTYWRGSAVANEISFTEFESLVEQKTVASVEIASGSVRGVFSDNSPRKGSFQSTLPATLIQPAFSLEPNPLARDLVKKGIKTKVVPSRAFLMTILGFGLLVYLLWRMSSVHFTRSIVAGAFYLMILWYVHSQYPLPGEVRGFFTIDALRFKLFDSGPIPLFILGTFFAGLHYLVVITSVKFLPFINADILEMELISVAKTGNIHGLEAALKKHANSTGLGYYGIRISRLLERFRSDQDLGAVIALKNDLLEIDEEDFANTFVGVTWAELALPLWGFLGTVVGVGEAIYSISNGAALIFQGGADKAQVMGHFNRGFQGMGVAFDTTFLGLGGVIVIGVVHTSLKKAFAARLAKARSLLAEIVEKFPTSSAGKIDPLPGGLLAGFLTHMTLNMAEMTNQISRLQANVSASDRRATLFRESFQYMSERIILEDPKYESIRDVLYVPIVQFSDLGRDFGRQIDEYLSAQLKHDKWSATSLGFPAGSLAGVLAIRDEKKNRDCLVATAVSGKPGQFLETSERFGRLYSVDETGYLGVTEGGALISGKVDEKHNPKVLTTNIQPEDAVLRVRNVSSSYTLLIRRQALATNVFLIDASSSLIPIGQLPAHLDWKLYMPNTNGTGLVAVGTDGMRSHLLRCEIIEESKTDPANPEVAPKKNLTLQTAVIGLPLGLEVKQAAVMEADQVLILDALGDVHYWQPTLATPRKLSHRDWKRASALCAGASGWVAVVANRHLHMWRIGYGGNLSPYSKPAGGFQVDFIDETTLQATDDGRFLVALGTPRQKLIFAWEFPRYAADAI